MNLILCCTMYQLINAVNILENKLKPEETDLLLCHGADFSSIVPQIEEMHLFRQIYQVPTYLQYERDFRDKLSDMETKQIGKRSKKFFLYPEFQIGYQHFYTPIDDVYGKLLYYYLLEGSSHIDIHFYEDGIASYTKDYRWRTLHDRLPHSYYGKKAFDKNIVDHYLYEPDLYCGSESMCPILPIDKLTEKNISTNVIKELFENTCIGRNPIQEPFVFFVEAFIDKFVTVEDIPVLDYIASIVGKENILVKLHPREPIDRFTRRGYKVEKAIPFPWEAQVLCNAISQKAVLSFSSTASLTAKTVFDLNLFSIFMYSIPVIGANYSIKSMPKLTNFFNKAFKLYEENCIMFVPKSFDELRENLLFIGGMLHG